MMNHTDDRATCDNCGKKESTTRGVWWDDFFGGSLCTVCAEKVGDPLIDRSTVAEVIEAARTGRSNTSHANCDHPRTPAGRAACRKARKA